MRHTKIAFFWLICLLGLFSGCDLLLDDGGSNTNNNTNNNNNNPKPKPDPKPVSGSMLPTQAKGDALRKYKYITISYSTTHKNPEWVYYQLTAAQVGNAELERASNFTNDPDFSGAASNSDYTGSGYDRGHLAPAEDMSFDETAMTECFYTTNIAPQDPSFNRGLWKSLEGKVRGWASGNKKIHVVTGVVLPARVTSTTETIGKNGDVVVPKQFYKIVLDNETPDRKAIAFLFNNEKADRPLKEYIVPIDKIEQLTKIDFFPSLSAADQEAMEAVAGSPAAWGF